MFNDYVYDFRLNIKLYTRVLSYMCTYYLKNVYLIIQLYITPILNTSFDNNSK